MPMNSNWQFLDELVNATLFTPIVQILKAKTAFEQFSLKYFWTFSGE